MAEGHQCQLCSAVREATHTMQVSQPGRATEHYDVCLEHGHYVSDRKTESPPAGTHRAALDKLRPAMADPATKIRGQRIREPASLERSLGLTPPDRGPVPRRAAERTTTTPPPPPVRRPPPAPDLGR